MAEEYQLRAEDAPHGDSGTFDSIINMFGGDRESSTTHAITHASTQTYESLGRTYSSSSRSHSISKLAADHEKDSNIFMSPTPAAHLQEKKVLGLADGEDTIGPHKAPTGMHDAIRVDTDDSLGMVRTISRVPGNTTYYEKGGLRTYGDGLNHTTEEPMTWRKLMIFVAMGFLWTGSQIPLYLFGGIIPHIEESIGGSDRYVWIVLANLIPLATVTPFVGGMSDVFGRRNIAMFSAILGIAGSLICTGAASMNVFIGGQTLIGVGAGIGELTALAVAGESAPTKKRGIYVGAIIMTIVPFCPSVLYAQLITKASTWRYVGVWTAIWDFIALALIGGFYWPPPRPNAGGLTRWQIAKRLDYVGGILSCGGLTLFLAGLTWAGNQYQWSDNHVRISLGLGASLIVLFFVWELWLVRYPMFPARLKQNPRALYVISFITFVSGANFFAVLVFWPTQYYAMYTGDTARPSAVSVGVGSLPVGICIIGGSIIFSLAVSILKGKVRLLMVVACIIMTAGNGSIAAANLDNLPAMYAAVSLACLGVGAVVVPSQIIASVICPDDLIATITALTISVRIVGGAIGYAAYYHILRTEFVKAVFVYLAPAVIKAGVLDPAEFGQIATNLAGNLRYSVPDFPAIDSPDKVAAVIHASRQCFVVAYHQVYYVSIAFGGAAILAAFFLPDITKLMDSHVAVQYRTAKRR